ncbi:MAG: hypothetical protein DRZ90_05275 [Spirochaetes bacterium]|nr:MAG: hypothetical protein DRP60_01400 [Spirochaetota bacterium]RKX97746.1 MAG: hypothetical protein DRZ90_05275 [Spirochaetota bacterium]
MKTFYTVSAVSLLIITLISCVSGPTEPVNAAAEESAVQVVTIWRPDSVVFKYIDGTVDKTIKYSYDDMGNEILSEEYDGNGELQSSCKTHYNQGVLLNKEAYDAAALTGTLLFDLDENGNITRIVKQDAVGDIQSIVTNSYQGNTLISSTAYDANEVPVLKTIYSYQEDILAGIEYQLPDGRVDARLVRTLENGFPVEEKVLLSDNSVESSRTFEYENGVLSGETQYAGTMEIKSVQYDYDENGNRIRETWSDRSGNKYDLIEKIWTSFVISE